jgi:predicted dehydrogenase
MQPVTAALLGVEHPHSLAHLRTLQTLPEVREILLWDENAAALAMVEKEHGAKVGGTFTDLGELLARPDLHFAIAALRNDLGPDVFVRVLEVGTHLMAEKPIGRTAADTARVLEVAERTGTRLGVCYQNRALPAVQLMRRTVADGLIGDLTSVEMRMITTRVAARNPGSWLFDRERAGGGILTWLGCHYLDMMRYVTGDEIVSVSAEIATRSGEEIDVEDIAVLSLRFRSGAVGSLHAGYLMALSGGGYHNPAGYDSYGGFNGRLGRITWSSDSSPTEVSIESIHPDWAGAPQRTFDLPLADSPAYGGVSGEQFLRDFIRATQGDGEPMAVGSDALQVARIIDAAYESSRTGRRVEVVAP